MKLLLWTREDPASLRVARELVASGRFPDEAVGDKLRIDPRAQAALGRVEGPLLAADYAERGFAAPDGERFERVLFLSKHSAASGVTALTVHPIGNLGPDTKFGGRPRKLSPPDPAAQTSLLRALAREAQRLGILATFEATHHGPVMALPCAFVEVGSTPADWQNDAYCAAVARAVQTAYLDAELPRPASVALGLGGGHYHPKHTDQARTAGGAFGHLVPAYALEGIEDDTLREAALMSGADSIALDRKTNPEAVDRAARYLETLGLPSEVLGP